MIEINGITYIPRERTRSKHHSRLAYLAMMLSMGEVGAYARDYSGGSKKAAPPEVNLIEELILIQNKQSKLSKSERDYVRSQFNKNFVIKTDDGN